MAISYDQTRWDEVRDVEGFGIVERTTYAAKGAPYASLKGVSQVCKSYLKALEDSSPGLRLDAETYRDCLLATKRNQDSGLVFVLAEEARQAVLAFCERIGFTCPRVEDLGACAPITDAKTAKAARTLLLRVNEYCGSDYVGKYLVAYLADIAYEVAAQAAQAKTSEDFAECAHTLGRQISIVCRVDGNYEPALRILHRLFDLL